MGRIDDLQRELDDWRNRLLLTPTKQPKAILANAITALRLAPEWQGVLAYDQFALSTMTLKPPPWLKHEDNCWKPQYWTDRDDALTTNWLHHEDIGVTVSVASNAIEAVAKDNSYHPIKDYLDSLKWDGVKRVENFATHYLGAVALPYHRAVSRCMFIAAVARIRRPGCKADYVPILEGPQDEGQVSSLAGSKIFDLDQRKEVRAAV